MPHDIGRFADASLQLQVVISVQCGSIGADWVAAVGGPARRPPQTAVLTEGKWKQISWDQIGKIIGAAVGKAPDCSPGARELLATIEAFRGEAPAVPADDKVTFYLRHRALIEEWADLRGQVLAEFEAALGSAVRATREQEGAAEISLDLSDANLPR